MINFPAVYIANGTALMLLLVILSSLIRPLRHGLFEEKIFYTMVLFNILQCFLETAAFFIDGKMLYGYRTLSIVINCIVFINSNLFAYFWTIYVDYKLFTDMKRIKRLYPCLLYTSSTCKKSRQHFVRSIIFFILIPVTGQNMMLLPVWASL